MSRKDRIVPREEGGQRLRRLQTRLNADWIWELVLDQFQRSGGTEAMAREFWRSRRPNPRWRLAVPRFIALKRSLPPG